jgi:DNA-binding XRE family transcriptional regulator
MMTTAIAEPHQTPAVSRPFLLVRPVSCVRPDGFWHGPAGVCRSRHGVAFSALGRRIKALRKDKHWSQKELGGQLGIRFQLLNKYESGLTTPPADMLIKLAEALTTSVDLAAGSDSSSASMRLAHLLHRFPL